MDHRAAVNSQPEAGGSGGTMSSRLAAFAPTCDSGGWRAQGPSCLLATEGNNICSGADEGLGGCERLKVVVSAPV